ncbi:MAG: LytTR family transcriptional regulator [Desulfitibacter sp. BRH_c19]|nr:MAG: LytTR family transcriptional regulator [Desulfitibacter sp. BRH_c19]
MRLKALIVDDEYPARMELRYLLEKFSHVEVVGEATNAAEALQLINALDYSIIFLDINMPGVNGLDLSKQIKNNPQKPNVIFVTAHEEYALEAFGVDAVDYLLKPVNPERLTEALLKVENRIAKTNNIATKPKSEANSTTLDIIPIESQGKTVLLKHTDIIYVNAQNDYCIFKTFDKQFLSRFTLKDLEARLNKNLFFRCHRSYLVNIKRVREVTPLYNGTLLLTVDDKEKSEVPVSRSQVKQIRNSLGM